MAVAADRTLVRVFHGGHNTKVYSVVLSRDGTRLVSHGYKERVVVWDVATGRCLCVCPMAYSTCFYMAFSPNRDHLAYGGYKYGYLSVCDSEQVVHQQLHDSVWCNTWTPDGLDVVCGCYKGTVERWTVATGQRVWQTMHHTNSVTCVAIAPDGQTGGKRVMGSHSAAVAEGRRAAAAHYSDRMYGVVPGLCARRAAVGLWLTQGYD